MGSLKNHWARAVAKSIQSDAITFSFSGMIYAAVASCKGFQETTMKKNRKSEKSRSKVGSRSKKSVFGTNDHRVHDIDLDPEYDAFYDEIDHYDLAISERFYFEELDRKSRNQRSRSRPRCWSPDWDHDEDDWN